MSRLVLRAAMLTLFAVCLLPAGVFAQANTATFLALDTATQGNWRAGYGGDGYWLSNYSQSLPSYDPSLSVQDESNWTWAASTTDPRALQISGSSRIAAAWYNPSSFSFDVNLTDGQSHRLALYAVDWDYGGRVETIQILNAVTNQVLDQEVLSNFTGGSYLAWNITGHVTIKILCNSGNNAVVSGLFFGGSSLGTIHVPR